MHSPWASGGYEDHNTSKHRSQNVSNGLGVAPSSPQNSQGDFSGAYSTLYTVDIQRNPLGMLSHAPIDI